MKITKYYNSDVLFESKKETLKETVIEAVEAGADLRDANFRGADLRDANFRGADLGDADFRGADLRGANFRGADLRDADLGGADFYHVKFFGRDGGTKIKESQIAQFHIALGIIVEKD